MERINIIGWFMWKKNINYGYILSHFTNDALPYTDSMSTVLSITAQILLMKRCMEAHLIPSYKTCQLYYSGCNFM